MNGQSKTSEGHARPETALGGGTVLVFADGLRVEADAVPAMLKALRDAEGALNKAIYHTASSTDRRAWGSVNAGIREAIVKASQSSKEVSNV